MNQTEILVKKITEGIQEKKGQKIIVADLTEIDDTICNYFVICQGNSPTQVSVIADSVRDYVRVETGNKPSAIDGLRNAQWVAMDYSDVLVHIFLPEVRTFYNLEKQDQNLLCYHYTIVQSFNRTTRSVFDDAKILLFPHSPNFFFIFFFKNAFFRIYH